MYNVILLSYSTQNKIHCAPQNFTHNTPKGQYGKKKFQYFEFKKRALAQCTMIWCGITSSLQAPCAYVSASIELLVPWARTGRNMHLI